eukprot:12220435-Alexandrium_andersonii.AAC.1
MPGRSWQSAMPLKRMSETALIGPRLPLWPEQSLKPFTNEHSSSSSTTTRPSSTDAHLERPRATRL